MVVLRDAMYDVTSGTNGGPNLGSTCVEWAAVKSCFLRYLNGMGSPATVIEQETTTNGPYLLPISEWGGPISAAPSERAQEP